MNIKQRFISTKPELRQFLGEIEKKAYEIYYGRKEIGIPGDDMTDWILAERLVKSKYQL